MRLVFLLLLLSLSAQANFEQNFMSPEDAVRALNQKFDGLILNSSCDQLDKETKISLGGASVATGETSVTTPGSAFVIWVRQCIAMYFYSMNPEVGNSAAAKALNKSITVEKLIPDLYAPLLPKILATQKSLQASLGQSLSLMEILTIHLRYDQLSATEKGQWVEHLMLWYLGTDDEVLYYGRMRDPAKFRQDILTYVEKTSYLTLHYKIQQIAQILIQRDEFFLY